MRRHVTLLMAVATLKAKKVRTDHVASRTITHPVCVEVGQAGISAHRTARCTRRLTTTRIRLGGIRLGRIRLDVGRHGIWYLVFARLS